MNELKGFREYLSEIYQVVNLDSNIDTLLRLGLGDPKNVSMYRKVLKNPASVAMDNQSKQMFLKMFRVFRNIIFNNDQVYNKIKANLITGKHPVHEEISNSRIDYLIRMGWGDQRLLVVYRNIIKAPESALNDSFKRKHIIDIFTRFRNIVLLDPYIFERAKRTLQGRKKDLS